MHSSSCTCHHHRLQNFPSSQAGTLSPWSAHSLPLPSVPDTHHLLSVSVNLRILGASYMWILQYFLFFVWLSSLRITSSMSVALRHVSACPSLLRLSTIPLWMDHIVLPIWFPSNVWLLWIMLLWPWVCKHLVESLLLVLVSTEPRVGLLEHTVIPCFIFEGNSTLFLQQLHHLHAHQQCTRGPISPRPRQHLFL